jgi:dihydrofolate reductase
LEENLIDEMVLSIIPVQLNNGTLLFEEGIIPDDFELKKKTVYPTGLIQFCYALKRQ